MSTHRKNRSHMQNPGTSAHPLWQGALFLTGAVAGAAFLLKSLRLQAEIQVDALHLVREQHLELSEQVQSLTQKVNGLNVTVADLSWRSQNDDDSIAGNSESDAPKAGSIEKSNRSDSSQTSSGIIATPPKRARKSTAVSQTAKKVRRKAASDPAHAAVEASQDMTNRSSSESPVSPTADTG